MNGEYIKRLRKERGLTQTELSIATGIPQGTLGRIEAKNEEVKKIEVLNSLVKFFKIENSGLPEIVSPNSENITNVGNGGVIRSKSLIPFYNSDFMAGKSEVFYEDGSDHPDYYMDVPEFYGCIAFRAFGDSMEPIIKSSSILFGIKEDDWMISLEYGQIYGITMKSGRRYLKYVRRSNDNPKTMFLLKSANLNYDDFEVEKSKIKNLWLIQGWIDKRA